MQPAGACEGSLQGSRTRKNGTDVSDREGDRLAFASRGNGERAIPAGDVPHAVSRGAIQRVRSCGLHEIPETASEHGGLELHCKT